MANLRVDKITSTETFEKTGSVQFDGTTGELTVSGSDSATTYDFGTDDFTIEFWRYKSTSAVESYVARLDSPGGSATSDFWFGNVNGVDGFYYYEGSTGRNLSTESQPLNTWAHLAVVRHNDYLTLYLNGKEVASRSHSAAFNNGSANLRIGGDDASSGNTNYPLEGFLSNVRITKKALYTSNFKPAMRELEVLPETILLACQSKTDASLEKTGKTLVVGGTPVASELTPGILTPVPKAGAGSAITGSVEFGENDYLTLTPSTDFNFGTGDFTIEFWIHPQKRFTSYPNIFNINDSVNASKLYINFRNGANLALTDSTTVFAQNGPFNLDDWFHVAVVRTSGQSRVYMNGVGGSSVSCTRDFGGSDDGEVYIGFEYNLNSVNKYTGSISNFRVVKGTALYTDDFIPPTRELKKVPGTVLLCCQDSNNPLTEATGKTITGYGRYFAATGELFANTGFTADSDWTKGSGWTISNGLATHAQGSAGDLYQSVSGLVAGQIYKLSVDIISTDNDVAYFYIDGYPGGNYITLNPSDTSPVGNHFIYFAAPAATVNIGFRGSSLFAGTITNLRLSSADHDKGASNFTPQVGDDRKVTFEGVTKINSDAYFYLPTGDTASREATGTYNAGTRAVYHSGEPPTTSTYDTLEYLTIASLGSVADFGNLTNQKLNQVSCSSNTRGLFGTGYTPSPASGNNFIDYVTIMSTGNAQDFGDLTYVTYVPDACSNQIRGIYAGGAAAPSYGGQTNIDYVTIASKGDGKDFGDLTRARHSLAGVSSPTRGVFASGNASPSSNLNNIDYVTIASTGNAQDFGDIGTGRAGPAGASSAIRGLFAGGYNPSVLNSIEFITIASMGNSQDFGDLTAVRRFAGATSSTTRGVFIAGYNPSATNTIDFVSIQTTGNATDFGDTTINKTQSSACSNGHGGLG